MIDANNIYSLLRKLAKSEYYSTLFSLSKERDSYRIFKNEYDFTSLQILFLKYLSFYSSIYTDIALKEVPEIILKDELYEDAYVMYKNKKDKKITSNKKEETTPTTKWLFKKSQSG